MADDDDNDDDDEAHLILNCNVFVIVLNTDKKYRDKILYNVILYLSSWYFVYFKYVPVQILNIRYDCNKMWDKILFSILS